MAPALVQLHDKPAGGGGIAQVVATYAEGLTARGWAVTDLRLTRRGGDVGSVMARPARKARADDAGIAQVRAAAARADAVLLHLGFSLLSPDLIRAAATSAPLFVHLHDVSPFCPNGLRLAWPGQLPCTRHQGAACVVGLCAGRGSALATARAGYRLTTRRAVWASLCTEATAILAPSRYLAEEALRAGAPSARLVRITLPVPMLDQVPQMPAGVPPSQAGPTIAYVGLLSVAKGAPMLLEAMAHLPAETRLTFYGDGPAAASMRARAAQRDLSGRVTFAGRVSQADLHAGLGRARVLAHPSLVPEGLGLAGPEAMALGRPVVGFGRGGSSEWLRHGETGLVAAAATATALADSLLTLLRDDELADRLGANAARLVRSHHATGPALDSLAARLLAPGSCRKSL
ncbi:glycosyltransferase family 4 protein [Rhodobacter ferrooxidans]|uniref:Glycosyl transferase group 1 n=1 Tax=Rhodobacter ferrooxidans TaxID=371731 RepID=C8S4A0_9RHOB|nr:glycosyltransferase family 4 protein [Rhodobacter sp. SW2]EEW24159.1 glycosyl transferase group 1 [Rhodobacter sp. SW2]